MSPGALRQTLEEWLAAAEKLHNFLVAEFSETEDSAAARQLIKDVLCAENRVRAVNGYPPRTFTPAD